LPVTRPEQCRAFEETFLHADSQGTSTVLCGDDLKSKLGSLPAQPILRTAENNAPAPPTSASIAVGFSGQ
jgi:hypothetical protein